MDLNWLESFLYGLFSGLTDILPVSAEAHRILVLKCFGIRSSTELMKLFAVVVEPLERVSFFIQVRQGYVDLAEFLVALFLPGGDFLQEG